MVDEDDVRKIAARPAIHANALDDAGKGNAAIEPQGPDRDVAFEIRFRVR